MRRFTIQKLKKKIKYIVNEFVNREKAVSYGNMNPDKKFYIIRNNYEMAGLFAIVKSNLSHIAYAETRGYIPVIDMQNYYNQYIDENKFKIDNSWEYYFEQPVGYSLTDIVSSKHVVLSKVSQMPKKEYAVSIDVLDDSNKDKFEYYKSIYKEYIRLNDETQKYVDEDYRCVIGTNQKVLGILCRGTDYLLKKPFGHPIQPEPDEVISKAKEVIMNNECDKIYLSTEDKQIYELFRKEFSDMLITNGQRLYDRKEVENVQYLSQIKSSNERDKYRSGLEYLSSINILSKCKYFIGGKTSGTLAVYFMTEGFDFDYVWNLGIYK